MVAIVMVRSDRGSSSASGARLERDEPASARGRRHRAPHRRDDRIEAAAPVQSAFVAIGALCARWTVGSTCDPYPRRFGPGDEAAAAPMVAAALATRQQAAITGVSELLGVTPAIVELRKAVDRAAAAPFAVVIDGESGSGKELVARAIHRNGPRRQRAFCTLNCAALPDDLVEAELFGHARGAFTGAMADRAGVFEDAHGGTLFLDEIGELSPRARAKSCASFGRAAPRRRTCRGGSTCGSCRRPTATCVARWRRGGSASTCSTPRRRAHHGAAAPRSARGHRPRRALLARRGGPRRQPRQLGAATIALARYIGPATCASCGRSSPRWPARSAA
jgi:hypothetical protein